MAQLPTPPPPPPPIAHGANGTGGDALLQEAQQEISSLRGELYATRRTGWAAQQALDKVPRPGASWRGSQSSFPYVLKTLL